MEKVQTAMWQFHEVVQTAVGFRSETCCNRSVDADSTGVLETLTSEGNGNWAIFNIVDRKKGTWDKFGD